MEVKTRQQHKEGDFRCGGSEIYRNKHESAGEESF